MQVDHAGHQPVVADVEQLFVPLREIAIEDNEAIQQFFPRLREMAARYDAKLPAAFVLILKQLLYFGRYALLETL